MAKLIFTSRYLKDAKPSQKENYVHYIGTRKGVEKIDMMLSRLVDTFFSRTSWTMLLYAENHSISVA